MKALKHGVANQLKKLDLSDMGMTDTGAMMLAEALAEKPLLPAALTWISIDSDYLHRSKLTNEGRDVIREGLKARASVGKRESVCLH